jgi:hypothetical protein
MAKTTKHKAKGNPLAFVSRVHFQNAAGSHSGSRVAKARAVRKGASRKAKHKKRGLE